MFVVELFLPLARGDGMPVASAEIEGIVAGMADRFGGATAFTRSPAEGLWKEADEVEHDRIVIVEVMVEEIDRPGGAPTDLVWKRNFNRRKSLFDPFGARIFDLKYQEQSIVAIDGEFCEASGRSLGDAIKRLGNAKIAA